MQQKRALQARQECLDVSDVEQCVRDLFEIVEDPAEILGSKKKRQAAPPYDESSQRAICGAFREVSQRATIALRSACASNSIN